VYIPEAGQLVPFLIAALAAARAAALLAAVDVISAGCGVGSRQLDSPTTACTMPPSDEGTCAAAVFEARPGRRCFVLIEGSATVEAAGNRLRELGAGAFVGVVDANGRPLPLSGLTVQLATHSRVLVIDARRLAVLIDSDPAAAAAWRNLSQQA
jgi:hypothetical protein